MFKYSRLFIPILFIILFVSCKDNSTTPDPGEPPTLPEVQNEEAQMDISFFEENPKAVSEKVMATTENFDRAKLTVTSSANIFLSASFYQSFLNPVSGEDATFNDGVWEWTYSYQYEGATWEMRTTAEEIDSETHWATYWSYDDGEGNSVENYKIFEGTVSKDGSRGSWQFNALNPEGTQEVPSLENTWEIISDTEKDLSTKVYDDSGSVIATYVYEERGADHTLEITYTDSNSDDVTVYWNTDTSEGYIETDGSRCSWDSQLQGETCS